MFMVQYHSGNQPPQYFAENSENYCRLCMSNQNGLQSIFLAEGKIKQKLVEKIFECTTVEITSENDYPSSVCQACILTLDEFHQYRNNCIQNDAIIRANRTRLQQQQQKALSRTASVDSEINVAEIPTEFFSSRSSTPFNVASKLQIKMEQSDDEKTGKESLECVENEPKIEKQPKFKCEICFKTFNFHGNFMTHSRIHSGEKNFKCDICEVSFARMGTLKIHKVIHSGERKFKCSECPKAFSIKHNLTNHFRIHSGDRPHQCQICQKSFNQSNILKRHLVIHNRNLEQGQHKCEECQLTFARLIQYKRHLKSHNNAKPHKCETCEKRFRLKNDLQRHSRIHSGDRPFQCPYCQKTFNIKYNMVKHSKLHSKDSALRCELCPKTFEKSSKLSVHMKYHSYDRKYLCDLCSRGFRSGAELERHVLTHIEKKEELSCEICGNKSFKDAKSLVKHLKKHDNKLKSFETALEQQTDDDDLGLSHDEIQRNEIVINMNKGDGHEERAPSDLQTI